MEASLLIQCIIKEKQIPNQINTLLWNNENELQIVRVKENLKLSYGGPSQGQTPGTNQRIKASHQGHHWVLGLTHRRATKQEIIAINRYWVYS